MIGIRSFQRNVVLLFLMHGFILAGLACEPDTMPLRNALCAKHPPPRKSGAISIRLLGPYYYDSTSARCEQYVDPAPLDLEASGYETWAAYYEQYVPFKSLEECLTVCQDPQPCDANNPCPPFEYTNSWPPYNTYPQTCVWVSSEGRGYCALQCQSQGLDVKLEHFGWSAGAICPDGFVCSAVAPGSCYPCQEYAEACVLPE